MGMLNIFKKKDTPQQQTPAVKIEPNSPFAPMLDFDSLMFQLREMGYKEKQIIGGEAIKFYARNIANRAQDASFELHKTSTPDVWKLYIHTKRTQHSKFALIAVFSVKKARS